MSNQDSHPPPIEYDSDDNPIPPSHKQEIAPLPPTDHSAMSYPAIQKQIYKQHPQIANLSEQQISSLRKDLKITIKSNPNAKPPPPPVSSFPLINSLHPNLISYLAHANLHTPTPVQAQAIPALLSGLDLIATARTGSGKTIAFLLPLFTHILHNSSESHHPFNAPAALICVPTRELAQQIHSVAKKISKAFKDLSIAAVYGGESKWEQQQAIKNFGCHIVIATPGRLIDLVKSKSILLSHVSFLVLDEADRMFDLGFEPQIKSIVQAIRPDRQFCLFSATLKQNIENLIKSSTSSQSLVRISIGTTGASNTDVDQQVRVFPSEDQKFAFFAQNLTKWTSDGSVLVFVTRKDACDHLASQIASNPLTANAKTTTIHGDMPQAQRNSAIHSFKSKKIPILIATDVAARGLDIPTVRTVVNFQPARDIDTHVHRIGRTGRAGVKGTAVTLLLRHEHKFASFLARNLSEIGTEIPSELKAITRGAGGRRFQHNRHGGSTSSRMRFNQNNPNMTAINPRGRGNIHRSNQHR